MFYLEILSTLLFLAVISIQASVWLSHLFVTGLHATRCSYLLFACLYILVVLTGVFFATSG